MKTLADLLETIPPKDRADFVMWYENLTTAERDAVAEPPDTPQFKHSIDEYNAAGTSFRDGLTERSLLRPLRLPIYERREIREVVDNLPPEDSYFARRLMRHGVDAVAARERWPRPFLLYRLRKLREACHKLGLESWPHWRK